jgi:hypothetical protein
MPRKKRAAPVTKPVPKLRDPIYDFNECRAWVNHSLGYDQDDVNGTIGKASGRPPYLNFWHWLIDGLSIHNGSEITLNRENLSEIEEDWAKKIYQCYLDEFANDYGELTMRVSW